jgi:hypothetical protein
MSGGGDVVQGATLLELAAELGAVRTFEKPIRLSDLTY